MADKVTNLGLAALPNPPALVSTTLHNSALAQHVDQMLRAQDNTLTPGRRVLLEHGMRGDPFHQVTEIDIDEGDALTTGSFPHFTADFERVVAEVSDVPRTPGQVLRIEARCIPSGPTREIVTGVGPEISLTGDTGIVRLKAIWDDGTATVTIVTELQFDAAPSDFAHGLDLSGMGFVQLTQQGTLNFPTDMLFDPSEVTRWTQADIKVSLTLSYKGAVRPVDVVVYETPFKIGRDDGSPAGPAHIYQENEIVINAFPSEYAIEGASSGDVRMGAQHTLNVSKASQFQIGPAILSHSSHTGSIRDDSGDPVPFEITSTTGFAPLDVGAPLGGGVEPPSFDMGVGSFGRRFIDSDPTETASNTGVCKVLVAVHWKKTGANDPTLRILSAAHSYIDLTTSSASYVWTLKVGHLECGQTVLDEQQVEVLGLAGAASTAQVRYVQIYYLPD